MLQSGGWEGRLPFRPGQLSVLFRSIRVLFFVLPPSVAFIDCSFEDAMWRSARRASTLLVQHSRSMATSCEVEKFVDHHRNLMHLGKRYPLVAPDAYVAPNATVVGDVDLDDRVTVGYGAVLRGDLNNITIGAVSNIGDRTVIHTARWVLRRRDERWAEPILERRDDEDVADGAHLQRTCTGPLRPDSRPSQASGNMSLWDQDVPFGRLPSKTT